MANLHHIFWISGFHDKEDRISEKFTKDGANTTKIGWSNISGKPSGYREDGYFENVSLIADTVRAERAKLPRYGAPVVTGTTTTPEVPGYGENTKFIVLGYGLSANIAFDVCIRVHTFLSQYHAIIVHPLWVDGMAQTVLPDSATVSAVRSALQPLRVLVSGLRENNSPSPVTLLTDTITTLNSVIFPQCKLNNTVVTAGSVIQTIDIALSMVDQALSTADKTTALTDRHDQYCENDDRSKKHYYNDEDDDRSRRHYGRQQNNDWAKAGIRIPVTLLGRLPMYSILYAKHNGTFDDENPLSKTMLEHAHRVLSVDRLPTMFHYDDTSVIEHIRLLVSKV